MGNCSSNLILPCREAALPAFYLILTQIFLKLRGTVLNPEESAGYVALCPELDIASQGESIEQAMHNLKEAVEGFFEVASPAEIETRL